MNDRAIGIFDSGLGGLTVVSEILAAMPEEDVIYLGDSARVPYGIKSAETIRRFALEDAAFLLSKQPKLLVVACNTASAAAIEAIEQCSSVPVVDVIRPGAAEAVRATDGAIGVVGTEATIASGAYRRAIHELDSDRQVIEAACPLLVPIVEEGRDPSDPIVLHVLADYLARLQRLRPGVLILGCTHYPLLSAAISKLMGPEVKLISSASAAAQYVRFVMAESGMRRRTGTQGLVSCYTTDNSARFSRLAGKFMGPGSQLESVEHIGTEDLAEALESLGGSLRTPLP